MQRTATPISGIGIHAGLWLLGGIARIMVHLQITSTKQSGLVHVIACLSLSLHSLSQLARQRRARAADAADSARARPSRRSRIHEIHDAIQHILAPGFLENEMMHSG